MAASPPAAIAEQLVVLDLDEQRLRLEAALRSYVTLKQAGLSWPEVDKHAAAIEQFERRMKAVQFVKVAAGQGLAESLVAKSQDDINQNLMATLTPRPPPPQRANTKRLPALCALGLLLLSLLLFGFLQGEERTLPALLVSLAGKAVHDCHPAWRPCPTVKLQAQGANGTSIGLADNATPPGTPAIHNETRGSRKLLHRPLWSSLSEEPGLVEEGLIAA